MTAFLHGYPLLDVVPYADDQREQWNLRARVMDNRSGRSGVTYDANVPIVGREFPWFLDGRAAIQSMLDFLALVKGRYQAFYMPTWHDDFMPTTHQWEYDSTTQMSTLRFQAFGYPDIARRMKRRQVALINNGVIDLAGFSEGLGLGVMHFGDNEDGTEYIRCSDSGLSGTLTPNTIVSFCPLVRLTNDKVEIEWWPHENKANVVLDVTEVIAEAPLI